MKKNPFHLPFYEIFFYPISSNSLSPSIDVVSRYNIFAMKIYPIVSYQNCHLLIATSPYLFLKFWSP
ncbi:hypothetical protein DERP_011327 [Dermatophagoides pteronyssinus]|uniref:Uncharacterized protein n=1 Tax=Dermatophagoides pteronyssinus TaxID=6956 RepID=A0ABQ8J7V6_DERPT|nr:hypothetical protein DERP_011327 [Dermatophagoides pteronyssinus]